MGDAEHSGTARTQRAPRLCFFTPAWVPAPSQIGGLLTLTRHLAGLSASPPDRVELIGAGSLGYGTGPSFG